MSELVASATRYLGPGDHRLPCPECHHTRKKQHEKELSVTVEEGVVLYHCWHCEAKGSHMQQEALPPKVDTLPSVPVGTDINAMVRDYLVGERGLSPDALKGKVRAGTKWIKGAEHPAVGFRYPQDGKEAFKWRALHTKGFMQVGVCRDFYLIEDASIGDRLIICEGEMDALAWKSAGLPKDVAVLSVPNGAPRRISDQVREDQKKFAYLYEAREILEAAPALLLNLDADEPGRVLEQEIRRRVQNANTLVIDLQGEKDAADYLKKYGADALRQRFDDASHPPLRGVHRATDYLDEVFDRYRNGDEQYDLTGIHSLDHYVKFIPGMVTVMTGEPGSGKSNFIDEVCVRMAMNHGWPAMLANYEKRPRRHIPELVQKIARVGWRDIPEDELQDLIEWLGSKVFFLDDSDRAAPNDIDGILEQAATLVLKEGVRLVAIDPYNHLSRGPNGKSEDSETEFVRGLMRKLTRFAKMYDVHLILVAHPVKPAMKGGFDKGKDVPKGYAISGSANFFNATDIGLTMQRTEDDRNFLHVWKVRFSDMGNLGKVELGFDPRVEAWNDLPNWRVKTEKIDVTFPPLLPPTDEGEYQADEGGTSGTENDTTVGA